MTTLIQNAFFLWLLKDISLAITSLSAYRVCLNRKQNPLKSLGRPHFTSAGFGWSCFLSASHAEPAQLSYSMQHKKPHPKLHKYVVFAFNGNFDSAELPR